MSSSGSCGDECERDKEVEDDEDEGKEDEV